MTVNLLEIVSDRRKTSEMKTQFQNGVAHTWRAGSGSRILLVEAI